MSKPKSKPSIDFAELFSKKKTVATKAITTEQRNLARWKALQCIRTLHQDEFDKTFADLQKYVVENWKEISARRGAKEEAKKGAE